MRYDDRLRTVLAQPADHLHDRAVRWRQLVELMARWSGDRDDLFRQAVDEVATGSTAVDEQVRMAAARTIAAIDPPIELICAFAADRLSVAAPLLASARLSATEWAEVTLAASPECRRFVASLRAEAPAPSVPEPVASFAPAEQPRGDMPTISEVLSRIERLRQSRESTARPAVEPQRLEEPKEPPKLFRWECDEAGEIDWVEGAPRAAVIGRAIAERADGVADPAVERAFALRVPFRDAAIELPEESELGGSWRISGAPAFEPSSGRFAGYRGVAEREQAPAFAPGPPALPNDPDSLRELAHEIKTPLNAIIGFAEMIGGEYLGPASEPYRARSNEIVTQARMLLAAVEDLDLAAKLCSPRAGEFAPMHLGRIIEELVGDVRELADRHGATVEASRSTGDLTVRIDPALVRRLVLRMCGAVMADARPGERLRLAVDQSDSRCTVSISLPQALRDLADEQLFGPGASLDGAGYWLRLVRMLARMSGAELIAGHAELVLAFPRG